MDPEIEGLIAYNFSKLPNDLKKAIAALPLSQISSEIAAKNNIPSGQSGVIYTETLLVLLEIEKSTDLQINLERELKIDMVVSTKIMDELKERVFNVLNIPTRSSEISSLKQNASIQTPGRSQILSEIENPTPVRNPISSPNQSYPAPRTNRDLMSPSKAQNPSNIPTNKPPAPPSFPKPPSSSNPGGNQSQSKGYGNDPYREMPL